MKNIRNNFIDSIGNTPLIKLKAASEIMVNNVKIEDSTSEIAWYSDK